MFNRIRYWLANKLMKCAHIYIKRGGFDNIMKGLDYIEASVSIVPSSKELTEFGERLKKLADENSKGL